MAAKISFGVGRLVALQALTGQAVELRASFSGGMEQKIIFSLDVNHSSDKFKKCYLNTYLDILFEYTVSLSSFQLTFSFENPSSSSWS